MANDVVSQPVRSSSDVAVRMGELIDRSQMNQEALTTATTTLLNALNGMGRNLEVFQNLVEEIKENGGDFATGANGTTSAAIVAIEKQTESTEKTNEALKESASRNQDSINSLKERIERENQDKNEKIENLINSLDTLEKVQQEELKSRADSDAKFRDRLYQVANMRSASEQQSSISNLLEAQDNSIIDQISGGIGSVSSGADTMTSVLDNLGKKGTGGLSGLGKLAQGASGVLRFLGPVGAALGAAASVIGLAETGIDAYQGLRSASLEATGTDTNLNVGMEQGLQSKLTTFTTNLEEGDIEKIQSGLMRGGATYGSESYSSGYDWVVDATQSRNMSATQATDLYVQQVVKGGKSIEYLNERLDKLAETAEATGASLSAITEQQQAFSSTMGGITGSAVEAYDLGVDITGWYGGADSLSAGAANNFLNYASKQGGTYFKQSVIEAQNQGMDDSQSYIYAMQQYANLYANSGAKASRLMQAILAGDEDTFTSLWEGDQDLYRNRDDIMNELASMFNGGQPLPVDGRDSKALYNYLHQMLVTDTNKALTAGSNIAADTQGMLDLARKSGGSTEAEYVSSGQYGFTEISALSNYSSGLTGSSLTDILSAGDYNSLSKEDQAVFAQSMILSGEITEDQFHTMSEADIAKMYQDTSWSYGKYGNQQNAATWLEKSFDWETSGTDWFSNATGSGNQASQYIIEFSPDASKMFYVKTMEGKEQYVADYGQEL